jgi:hypothetical protein
VKLFVDKKKCLMYMCENQIEDGRKTLTDSTREQHKQDNPAKYNKTRVCIGDEYDGWTAPKDVLRIKAQAEVAKALLDR